MLAWRRRVGTGTKRKRQLGKRHEFFLLFRPAWVFSGPAIGHPGRLKHRVDPLCGLLSGWFSQKIVTSPRTVISYSLSSSDLARRTRTVARFFVLLSLNPPVDFFEYEIRLFPARKSIVLTNGFDYSKHQNALFLTRKLNVSDSWRRDARHDELTANQRSGQTSHPQRQRITKEI